MNTNHGSGYRIINLGSDRPIRLDELVASIGEALGVKVKKEDKDDPAGDVKITWADLGRANKELAYMPKVELEKKLGLFVDSLKSSKYGPNK